MEQEKARMSLKMKQYFICSGSIIVQTEVEHSNVLEKSTGTFSVLSFNAQLNFSGELDAPQQ